MIYIYLIVGPGQVDIFNRVANPVFGCTVCRIWVRTECHLFTCKKLVMACESGLLGADISIGSRQPRIDNRLQCTVS